MAGYGYQPYGAVRVALGMQLNRGYTGHFWDAHVGQYHTAFRFYSSSSNRWLTRDPLGFVDGMNLYGYVRCNPVMYMDPLGLSSVFGAFCEGANDGAQQLLDVLNPFGDPLSGNYDSGAPGMPTSRGIAEAVDFILPTPWGKVKKAAPVLGIRGKRNPKRDWDKVRDYWDSITKAQNKNPKKINSTKKARQIGKKSLNDDFCKK